MASDQGAMNPDARPELAGQSVTRIHAVGVGGMGLGPLAIYLAQRGWRVTGEDDALGLRMAAQLKRAGVFVGPSGRDDADLLVISSAIKSDHPALVEAESRGIPVQRRGEILAAVAAEKKLVGIAGSHGKTTVAAMTVAALQASGERPSFVLGALWADPDLAPAEFTGSDWLVAEIDESDGTIDGFSPEITVIVNLDWDHADRYDAPAKLEETFAHLVTRTRGVVLGPAQGESAQRLLAATSGTTRSETFGANGGFALEAARAREAGLQLQLGGSFNLSVAEAATWGDFNALNATAALATVQLMGGDAGPDSLQKFPGVHRRQSVLWDDGEHVGIEDYAHHPAEITALLRGVRQRMPSSHRLVVVFQPHRYSRTRQFKAEFAESLRNADVVHLREVYGAGEAPRAGGHTADLAEELAARAPELPVTFTPGDGVAAAGALRDDRQPGDWVVFVGAGDIENEAHRWAESFAQPAAAQGSWSQLFQALQSRLSEGTKLRAAEPLASKTTLRIGGAARIYVEPASVADLGEILRQTSSRKLPIHMLGRGSNLLIPDTGVDGVVISLRHGVWSSFAVLDNGRIQVGAGLRLKNLCGLTAKAGLAGFEFLEGIPGNVGGALRMNAGAMGGWMFDVVETIEVMSRCGDRVEYQRDQLHVGYRHCEELQDAIAIAAVLKPQAVSESDRVGRQIDVYRTKRQESQPREPSAGCIFKNPEGDSAGRLIDLAGLKGSRVGDAEVSTVHGNFIVNRGRATSADVVELVKQVRAGVKEKSGVELQPEVLLYGAKWEDLL